jgi:hypothetical protein
MLEVSVKTGNEVHGRLHSVPREAFESERCQSVALPKASKPILRYWDLAYRLRKHWEQNGFRRTVRKIWNFLLSILGLKQTPAHRGVVSCTTKPEEILSLSAGELVEVKTEREIRETLDADGKLRGLAFLPAMREYCGRRFVVLKRVQRIYLEESCKTRKMKNTVLLKDVMCDGLLMGCDRSCYFYWREAWLRRPEQTDDSLNHS